LIQIEPAKIEWREGAPFSLAFNDVYFQPKNGLAESQYVFIDANRVAHRLRDSGQRHSTLVIAETGFGTGLNFIATYALWKSLPEPKRPLEFVSIEGFPLTKEDLSSAAALWPALTSYYEALLEQYPLLIRGAHSLSFEDDRVRLRLVFDTLEETIQRYDIWADAWYLDGFAPSKNDAMWTDKLFNYIGSHSRKGCTLSTFSAAGFVKRGLTDVGFTVEKVQGYGRKREMITAYTSDSDQRAQLKTSAIQPWHLSEPTVKEASKEMSSPPKTLVVGAGIVGLTTALLIARRGHEVTIIDKGSTPLCGGSSQPQLIMYGKFPVTPNNESELLLLSQLYAQRFYQNEQQSTQTKFWHPVGVNQLGWNEKESSKQKRFITNFQPPKDFVEILPADQTTEISGIQSDSPSLFFPQAGWLDTQAYAKHVIEHPSITFIGDENVVAVNSDATENSTEVVTHSHTYKPDNVIICAAYGALKLYPELKLPMKNLRGQTTQLSSCGLDLPKTVMCGEGYLSASPTNHELHLGATYDLINTDSQCRDLDNIENIKQLCEWLPNWSNEDKLIDRIRASETGLRCTTSDYTPIVGPLPDICGIQNTFSRLRQNAKAEVDTYGEFRKNVFLNVGYGSKGLTFAPACADLIHTLIERNPASHPHNLQRMLSPARFIIRSLKKNVELS